MSFLAKTNVIAPKIIPIPQQQQVSIDRIPRMSMKLALGNFCFSMNRSLEVSHFVNIRNNHDDGIQNSERDNNLVVVSAFIYEMQSKNTKK